MPDTLPPDELARNAAARETFSHLVAHALNGAIYSVVTGLALLGNEAAVGTLNPAQRNLLRNASDGAAQLRQLTDDILLLTAAAAQSLAPQRQPLALTTLVREATAKAQTPYAPTTARTISARITPALPLLLCDPTLLQRALAAIIENALRFSPAEAPVEVAAHKQRERIIISVRDHGAGVAPDQIARIFEPLYSGQAPREPVGVGLGVGLGLAVARVAIEAHGGRVSLRQSDATGTLFSLELPFAPDGASG
jgi:signal transduction histidine kinase